MQTRSAEQTKPPEERTEDTISFQDYLKQYDGRHAEWHMGRVEVFVANNEKHQAIFTFLITLFNLYLGFKPVGKLLVAAFSMYVGDDWPAREPDLMIVLNENRERIKPTYLDGPADICIEIVSPESSERDYGAKFHQYEANGVREYWRIDPIRNEVDIFVRGEDEHYHRSAGDEQGRIVSTLLPGFALDPHIFWQDEMPDGLATMHLVQQMVENPATP